MSDHSIEERKWNKRKIFGIVLEVMFSVACKFLEVTL